MTDHEKGVILPELHTERVDIEGGRYLIYYTFDTGTAQGPEPETEGT